jgi:hypothetical protein
MAMAGSQGLCWRGKSCGEKRGTCLILSFWFLVLSLTIARTIDGIMDVSWRMTSFTKLLLQPERFLAPSPAARADLDCLQNRESFLGDPDVALQETLRRLHN